MNDFDLWIINAFESRFLSFHFGLYCVLFLFCKNDLPKREFGDMVAKTLAVGDPPPIFPVVLSYLVRG
jgi:hypothetical protein